MKISALLFLISLSCLLVSCAAKVTVYPEEEKYISNLKQLTFDGENAEGYFNSTETKLTFQRRRSDSGNQCDQIYTYDLKTDEVKLISTGYGATTCSYFLPGDTTILYASTHAQSRDCPPPPDRSHGYAWAMRPEFDIFVANLSGELKYRLTYIQGYDAEATVSPKKDRVVFTTTRTGDIELFSMNIDGTDKKQLTNTPGYDGGAFYSWDGQRIVYRADHPVGDQLLAYQELLKKDLVRPSKMELYVMNADGTGVSQITNNGAANFAPFWYPDNKHIIFASNVADPKGRNFDLYVINDDGTNMRRITVNDTFDGFPVLTHDGKHMVFASNRNAAKPGETNLFYCDFNLGE